MPTGGANFKWDGDDAAAFSAKVKRAHKNLSNQALFEMYERRFRGYMSDMFKTEGASADSPWKKLSSSYIDWKGHDTIGVLSGKMQSSLTGGDGYFHKITHDNVQMGQRKGFAPWTKFFRNGRVPRSIELSSKERNLWKSMAQHYYAETIRNAMDPKAKNRSIRLPDGSRFVVHKDGSAHARSGGAQFVRKAVENSTLQRMKRAGGW